MVARSRGRQGCSAYWSSGGWERLRSRHRSIETWMGGVRLAGSSITADGGSTMRRMMVVCAAAAMLAALAGSDVAIARGGGGGHGGGGHGGGGMGHGGGMGGMGHAGFGFGGGRHGRDRLCDGASRCRLRARISRTPSLLPQPFRRCRRRRRLGLLEAATRGFGRTTDGSGGTSVTENVRRLSPASGLL